jgi:hypothetical protein
MAIRDLPFPSFASSHGSLARGGSRRSQTISDLLELGSGSEWFRGAGDAHSMVTVWKLVR